MGSLTPEKYLTGYCQAADSRFSMKKAIPSQLAVSGRFLIALTKPVFTMKIKTLQSLHLYLGCAFAPLLIFFAVSGIWQMFNLQKPAQGQKASILTYLSTIHTGHGLKTGEIQTLSSPIMKWVAVAMAVSLVFTIVLGIFMAFKFGRQKTAGMCLLGGTVVPVLLVLLAIFR